MSKQMKDTAKPNSIFHPSSYSNSYRNHLDNDQNSISPYTTESLKSENIQKYNSILNLQKSAGNQAVPEVNQIWTVTN